MRRRLLSQWRYACRGKGKKKTLSAAYKRSEQIWWCATDRKVGGSGREPLRCLTWCRFNKDWQQSASRVFLWEAAIKLLKAQQGHLGENAHHISIIGGRISDDGSWICGGSSRLTLRAPGMRRQNERINNEPMSAHRNPQRMWATPVLGMRKWENQEQERTLAGSVTELPNQSQLAAAWKKYIYIYIIIYIYH